ncbi:MAG: cation diffusion facilitator family transporter [Prevotella sp.]
MTHHHHHHSHLPQPPTEGQGGFGQGGLIAFSIFLNILFVAVEAVVGLLENSLSLLSDAGHNLSDVFSLVLVLVAFKLSKVHANGRFTYGYRKSTVLISLLNAIILLVAVGAIVIESIHKFYSPAEVNGVAVSWTATVGIVINGVTALLLMKGQKNDINVRGAFLHMAADTLVSIGVVVSGLVITFSGWNVVDPIVSLVIAAVILVSTWGLLSASLRLSMDGMPEGIDLDDLEAKMRAMPGVVDVHHIHVWAISTTENALTAHIVVHDLLMMEQTKQSLKTVLKSIGIGHSTLEFETSECQCVCHECH